MARHGAIMGGDRVGYGGLAVVEGVMMRGRREMAVAVRRPDGELVVWSEPLRPSRLAASVRDWPFVRGAVLLWDAMSLGLRALIFSSSVGAPLPAGGPGLRHRLPLDGRRLWPPILVSIASTIGIFFLLPLAIVAGLDRWLGSAYVANAVEGTIRLGLLVGYVQAIGYLPEIRRVFGYHGAEHKAINAWEAGAPLDVEHVLPYPVTQPRCGTGFMLVVMVLSLALFVALGRLAPLPRLASRVLLVPLVAAVAYELVRLGARHPDHRLARPLLAPGLWLQRLTTREPDAPMVETAIAALRRVLAADGPQLALQPESGLAAPTLPVR